MCTQSTWPSTAIIGVGQLGAAVAGNLIRNKVPLTLYDLEGDKNVPRPPPGSVCTVHCTHFFTGLNPLIAAALFRRRQPGWWHPRARLAYKAVGDVPGCDRDIIPDMSHSSAKKLCFLLKSHHVTKFPLHH